MQPYNWTINNQREFKMYSSIFKAHRSAPTAYELVTHSRPDLRTDSITSTQGFATKAAAKQAAKALGLTAYNY